MLVDDLCIGEESSSAKGPAHSYTACELSVEGAFQMCNAFFPEGADMEPEKTRGRHHKQCIEQCAEGLDGMEPEIDQNHRQAPADLLPLAGRRSLWVGHHVKREEIEARRGQR